VSGEDLRREARREGLQGWDMRLGTAPALPEPGFVNFASKTRLRALLSSTVGTLPGSKTHFSCSQRDPHNLWDPDPPD
jgi:hypothetical protein